MYIFKNHNWFIEFKTYKHIHVQYSIKNRIIFTQQNYCQQNFMQTLQIFNPTIKHKWDIPLKGLHSDRVVLLLSSQLLWCQNSRCQLLIHIVSYSSFQVPSNMAFPLSYCALSSLAWFEHSSQNPLQCNKLS